MDASTSEREPANAEFTADIGWFIPDLSENPFHIRQPRDRADDLAARRARQLVGLLNIAEARRRRSFVAYFSGLLDEFSHPNTFRALEAHAESGIEPDMLRTACAFRRRWLENPEWWAVRDHRANAAVRRIDGALLMGWSRALRLTRYCDGDDPADQIDDEMLADWLELPAHDQCRLRFADYLEARLRLRAADIWEPIARSRDDWPNELSRRDMGLPVRNLASRTGAMLHGLSYQYGLYTKELSNADD